MAVEIRCEREVQVVSFPSQLDAIVARDARQKIQALIEAGSRHVVLDLEEVRFVDSAGLSAIVSALRAVRSVGGDIVLLKVRKEVRAILELTRLDQVFEIYEDASEAVAAVAE